MKEKKQKAKKLILALGESTNTHQIQCETEIEYTQGEGANAANIDFLLKETGVVTHEEHSRQVLPGKGEIIEGAPSTGHYSKVQQVEINPLDQSLNRVFD